MFFTCLSRNPANSRSRYVWSSKYTKTTLVPTERVADRTLCSMLCKLELSPCTPPHILPLTPPELFALLVVSALARYRFETTVVTIMEQCSSSRT